MSVQPLESRYREKRRHIRQPTLLAARLYRGGDSPAIAVEIRDYCQSGLFLAFVGHAVAEAGASTLVGTPVVIEFGNASSGSWRIEGSVARAVPNAVGIFVRSMPEAAFQFLRHRSASNAGDDGASASNPDKASSQAHALKRECVQVFRQTLDAVLQDFFMRAEERLNTAGMESLSFLERSNFHFGAQELSKHRRHIETDYFDSIRERVQTLAPFDDVDDPPAAGAPRSAGKLALVDEDEFEDWLNLSAVIKQVEGEITLELDTFEVRYGRLVGARINRKNNPFGPESIGRAFQSAIRILDFSNALRAVLYKTFGLCLTARSAELYERLNKVLASLDPGEPDKSTRDKREPEPVAPARPVADESDPAAAGQDAALAEALANLFRQDRPGESGGAASSDYSLDRILSQLAPAQRGDGDVRPAPRERIPRIAPGSAAADSVVPTEVLQMARQLRKSVGRPGERDTDATVSTGLDPAALVTSLNDLKHSLDRFAADSAQRNKQQRFTEQLAAYLAQDAASLHAVAPLHRKLLERAADFFGRTQADLVQGSDIEALIERMQIPLLKLSLDDASFPDQPDHPARQVINLIEQFTVAADDNGKLFDAKLRRFLFTLVDRIRTNADAEPDIFITVREQLEKVLHPILHIRRSRVARMQEASEARDRIRSARARVNEALERMLAGRQVPGMILRLLDAGWRHHLVLLEMRGGIEGEAAMAALGVLERVLDCLTRSERGEPATQGDVGALVDDIERGLQSVNVEVPSLAAFIEELYACLVAPQGAQLPGCTTVYVPPGRLARNSGDARNAADTTYRFLVNRLRVGEWWNLELSGKSVPMQLIWTSEDAAVTTFANRSATNKIEYALPELSRQVQSRLARPGKDMDMPVVERAEHALFDETYQELMDQVLHDETTGLLNRKGFMQRLKQVGMPEDETRTHAVGIIEFDQFRVIYNTCGVEAVETLARALAQEARSKMGPDAVLAAFRDDTLAVLLPNCSRATGCEAVDQLLAQLRDYRFEHGVHRYSIGFNLGVAEFAPEKITPSDAIRRADSACITAKSQGRNRMQIYEEASPQLQNQVSLMDWAGRVDAFLQGDGLRLRCQQVRPLDDEAPHAPYYEVLLGIVDEAGAEINPMHFIPAIEGLQRAHEVDMWVIRKVFAWIADNRQKFDAIGGFAINLSAMSLSSPEVITFLKDALRNCEFPAHKITFEITETAAIGSYGAAQDFIREIRRYGCRFALDDFGSGFTSYAHLKNLRTDALKIDGSFVKDMLNNPGDYAMVKSMNDIGHSLGLKTVAEYVESPRILQALREIGVDYAQGYAVHKPCAIDDLPFES